MNENILEVSAFLVSLFCFTFSVAFARGGQKEAFPEGLRRKLSDQRFVFLALLLSVTVSSAASVTSAVAQDFHTSILTLELLHEVYYISHNALSCLFTLYVLNLTGVTKKWSGGFFGLFFLACLCAELLILTNPLTHVCFYVDASLVYHRGAFLWALYVVAAFYSVIGVASFLRFDGAMPRADRWATLTLIVIALLGVVIQALWSVLTELFFESIAFLGFMALLENRNSGQSYDKGGPIGSHIIVIIALVFLAVLAMNISLIFNMTAAQTEEIGNIQLYSIRGDLQKTISDAEGNVLRLAMGAEQLISSYPSREEMTAFIVGQKATYASNPDGVCFNVYYAGSTWHIIPDFDAPDDYHAAERLWYIGAKENFGQVYITEPYLDANTGNMCFTVSTMLSDEDTVVAMDFNFSKLQESILRMTDSKDQTAMIVTAGGLIVGYTDMSLVGERAADKLPDYADILERVTASKEHDSFRARLGGKSHVIFSSQTSNDWYLILSVDTSALYANSYRQTILMAAINLLMVAVIIVFYMVSVKSCARAEAELSERDALFAGLSVEMREPLRRILRLSDLKIIEGSENPQETVGQIKESALRLSDSVNNLISYSDLLREKPAEQKNTKKSITANSSVPGRLVRNGVIAVLLIALSTGLALCVRTTVNWGDIRMSREADTYNNRLSEWVTEQESILRMFTDMISARPELMEDYEEAVRLLHDVSGNYSDISACYMANPYWERPLIMDSGWEPDEDFRVENRPWYISAERSPTGTGISVPYLDAQTGVYCITMSRVVYGGKGEFLGIFGIDFYMDKLVRVLSESYTADSYAFLIDPNGAIVNHPNGAYQMSPDNAVNVQDTDYANAYYGNRVTVFRDYHGGYAACLARRSDVSDFTVMVVNRWWSIYKSVVLVAAIFAALFILCSSVMMALIDRLIRWQREVNAQLVEAAEAAVSGGRAKSQFLAQMSHEIRTPINAVLGMNEMILAESSDPDILDYAASIQSAGRTLLALINSILDFSKIEDGKMEIIPAKYDTLSLIDDLVTMGAERASKKGLDFRREIDPGIPHALYGDDMRIRQIITNLLSNALKYTPSGSVTLRIRSAIVSEDTCELSVSVIDTGIGIRTEDMEKLYESFQRLDEERNRNIEGTGLGVSIVRKLLAMMESELRVESVYGEGSTFSFRLNQRIIDREGIGDYDARRASETRRTRERKSLWVSGADVLVVDDNDMNLKVAKGLMKRCGIVPDLAEGGAKCLKMAREKRYDIIFMDHMMPGMDGIQTLGLLKEEGILPDGTAVIALTANAVVGARESYLDAGFQGYLSKPIEVTELEETLARYLPEEKYVWRGDAPAGGVPNAQSGDADTLTRLGAAGYNVKAGLGYAAGDRAFYLELLRDFVTAAPRNAGQIRADYESGALSDYQTRVHALKSGARMIGADALSELALAQETAAKNQDSQALEQGAETLLLRYSQTAKELRAALGLPDAAPDGGSRAELAAKLREAADCLSLFETGRAGEILHALRDTALYPALEEICRAVDDFETETAQKALEKLLETL